MVSTEGRVFVAQLVRDLRRREKAGASLLSPGCHKWVDAFQAFGLALSKIGSPVKAGKMFAAARDRLHASQKNGGCYVNAFATRSRSGAFECLTWEVAQHPLTRSGYEGIVVHGYLCLLQRNGRIVVSKQGQRFAFLSWHTLARLAERWKGEIFQTDAVVAGCGFAGLLMRESTKHTNTGINYVVPGTDDNSDPILCTGVLRYAANERGNGVYGFFDVITALPFNEHHHALWAQGVSVSLMVKEYVTCDDADPSGWAERKKIAVLPAPNFDYVSKELKNARDQARA